MEGGSPQPLMAKDIRSGLAFLFKSKRQAIDEESKRFVTVGDAEALHDLRVAMRRLHSLFVAFSPAIAPSTPFPQELKSLQKSTNHARDLEVALSILRNSQLGLTWLEHQWQQELEREYTRLRQTLPTAWVDLSPVLDDPSHLLCDAHHLPPQNLGHFAAKLLQAKTEKLKKRQKKLCRDWQDRPAHKLRIIGKQTRYLLEPFAEEDAACQKGVAKLKPFQDLLGDYHDLVVMRGKLKNLQSSSDLSTAHQLKQARKQLKKELQSLHKTFEKRYCRNKGKNLLKTLHKAGKALVKS
jgi:CHAD domain-containing protein